MYYEKYIFVGNMTKDPEMTYTPEGKAFTRFNMALNRKYGGKESKKFIACTCFGSQAEYLAKWGKTGMPVLVEGILEGGDDGNPQIYQRKDGTVGTSFKVLAQNVSILASKSNSTADDDEYGGF